MLITFKSVSKAHQKDNKIEFTSPVEISEWNGFKVYEFNEPTIGERNRVEISSENVNIIAGHNTLNLTLGEKVNNEYIVPSQGSIYIQTKLHRININDELVELSYSLYQNDQEISIFELELKITK